MTDDELRDELDPRAIDFEITADMNDLSQATITVIAVRTEAPR